MYNRWRSVIIKAKRRKKIMGIPVKKRKQQTGKKRQTRTNLISQFTSKVGHYRLWKISTVFKDISR